MDNGRVNVAVNVRVSDVINEMGVSDVVNEMGIVGKLRPESSMLVFAILHYMCAILCPVSVPSAVG